jgi:Ca2+-binding RTX toxin-like protein
MVGGDGNDAFSTRGGDQPERGTSITNVAFGGSGNDAWHRFQGWSGAQRFYGGAGRDSAAFDETTNGSEVRLVGGPGDDILSGQLFNTDWQQIQFVGGSGNDFLFATQMAGRVVLSGGRGQDIVAGGASGRRAIGILRGGPGRDEVSSDSGRNIVRGGSGDDRVDGFDGNEILYGGPGDDTMRALAGDDVLRGGPGNDTMHAGEGADRLRGRAGDDKLFGETGNDVLRGGRGRDTNIGGVGVDFCRSPSSGPRAQSCER